MVAEENKTKGIAGKDISWINVSPRSLRGSDNEGKNLPIKIEIGSTISKKNLGFLRLMRNDLIDEYFIVCNYLFKNLVCSNQQNHLIFEYLS